MGRPLILVALIDALGWRPVAEADWLADLLPHRRRLTTVLGFSSGAIPALLSGTWPCQNGRWLMYARAANGSSPLGVAGAFARLPGRLRRSYKVSRLLHRMVARRVAGYFALYEVPWRLLPHFDLAERRPLYAPGGLDGQATWFDAWRGRGYRVEAYDWRTAEADNAAAVLAACGRSGADAADVVFWYTPGLDARQHRFGTGAAESRRHLEWLGERLRAAHDAATGTGRECWAYVYSDHGMTDVERHVDVMAATRAAAEESDATLVEGRDWLAFYDSTLARFWWPSVAARRELRPRVRERLAALGAGRWLDEDDERRLGVHFPDRRYGEDLFLVDPGVLVLPSYMSSEPVRGMHGYDPSEPTADAVTLSNRPMPDDLDHVVGVRAHLERESEERDRCPARS